MSVSYVSKLSAAALITCSLAVYPALAGNGNGNGGGNGGGNSASASASGDSHGKSESHKSADMSGSDDGSVLKKTTKHQHTAKADKTKETASAKDKSKANASAFGKLNGFLHASDQAIKKAAPNSAIGLVAHAYADDVSSFLTGGASAKTAADCQKALSTAAGKPVTAAMVAAVDAKLAKTNPALAAQIAAYPGGADALAKTIASGT